MLSVHENGENYDFGAYLQVTSPFAIPTQTQRDKLLQSYLKRVDKACKPDSASHEELSEVYKFPGNRIAARLCVHFIAFLSAGVLSATTFYLQEEQISFYNKGRTQQGPVLSPSRFFAWSLGRSLMYGELFHLCWILGSHSCGYLEYRPLGHDVDIKPAFQRNIYPIFLGRRIT
jgi:hypothetical protein